MDRARFNELTMSIEQFMGLCYNPKQKPATLAEIENLVSVGSGVYCNQSSYLEPTNQLMKDIPYTTSDDFGLFSSFSSDASSISSEHHRSSGATSGIGSGSGANSSVFTNSTNTTNATSGFVKKFRRDSGLCSLLKHISTSSSFNHIHPKPDLLIQNSIGPDNQQQHHNRHNSSKIQRQQQRSLFGQSVPTMSNIFSFRGQKLINHFHSPPSSSNLSLSPSDASPMVSSSGTGTGGTDQGFSGNSFSRLISKYGPLWSIDQKLKHFQSTGGLVPNSKHVDSGKFFFAVFILSRL